MLFRLLCFDRACNAFNFLLDVNVTLWCSLRTVREEESEQIRLAAEPQWVACKLVKQLYFVNFIRKLDSVSFIFYLLSSFSTIFCLGTSLIAVVMH